MNDWIKVGFTSVIAALVLFGSVPLNSAVAADTTAATKKELLTAATHAGAAAGYNTLSEITLHLHHVVNCIQGKAGRDYFKPSGDMCQGMGNGILADLKSSEGVGARALPYVQIANRVALWGLMQASRKDVASTKAAAQITWMTLEQAQAHFK